MSSTPSTTRRDFLKATAVAGAAALATDFIRAPAVHAASSDTLKVGLIGCGGRGTGAARQALMADKNVKLVALGDAFRDRLDGSLKTLRDDKAIADKIDVKDDHCFIGFDAYKNVIDACDVVLLTTPPHFRPAHLKYAVEKGRHIFAEKPLAIDGPGVRSVLQSAAEAKKKNLALVSGFCWRADHGMREALKRVHDGEIGDIVALQCTYNTGGLWMHARKKDWSDMEWQLRNWLYFTWLSGDHIVEQAIHSIDKTAWAMKDTYPAKAVGLGGRQVRTEPAFGHIFDHHAVVFEYASGVKIFHSTRQQEFTDKDVSDQFIGTKGVCNIDASGRKFSIKPHGAKEPSWRIKSDKGDMYQTEHDELFASIRAGKPINHGEWAAQSTMMGILGRMATYTGQVIGWEQAMNSKEDFALSKYEFGSMEVAPVAQPGVTKFS